LFLNPIVELLLFCLYMSVIPIKYVYTKMAAIFKNRKFLNEPKQLCLNPDFGSNLTLGAYLKGPPGLLYIL